MRRVRWVQSMRHARSVTVANRLGLHARAAARFVHLASRFQSHVKVSRGSQTMDGKSIMGILLLAAADRYGADAVDRRRRRAGGARRALRLHRDRIRRGHVQRLSGIGVSGGVGRGPRRRADSAGAGAPVFDRRLADRRRDRPARARAPAVGRAARSHSAAAARPRPAARCSKRSG